LPAFPGFAQSLRPGLCQYPPRVPCFAPPLRYICFWTQHGNSLWPHTILGRRLCLYGLVELLPPQHPPTTEALHYPKSEGLTPRCGLLHPQDTTDSLADEPGQGPPSTAPIHHDGSMFPPKSELRWLRLWFTPSLVTTSHFTKWLTKAHAAFMAIKLLSPPGMGLPPYLCHRFAVSLLFPILSYGGDIFHPTVHMVRKLAVFCHKVQRWCMNCFSCTPTDILAIEACLPPLELLLVYKRRLANLRVLCSPPEINPAMARLAPSVQTLSLHRHSPDHRTLLVKNAGRRLPLPWLQPRPPTKNMAHLPLDAVPHLILFLLAPDGLSPLPVTPSLSWPSPTQSPRKGIPTLS